MKTRFLPILLLLIVFSCAKESLVTKADAPVISTDPMSREAINEIMLDKLNTLNDFNWNMVDDQTLWSAALLGDSIVTIGFKPADEGDIKEKMHQIDVNDERWTAAKNTILEMIQTQLEAETGEATPILQNPTLKAQRVLPMMQIKLGSYAAIAKLRQMPEVRYVEPSGYSYDEESSRSGLGCGLSPAGYINPQDYTTVSPSAKVPWNFYNNNIPAAWTTTSGNNIAVALLDTGTSPNQSKLGSEFNSGQSQGRNIDRLGFYVSSWWWWGDPDGPDDQCGHGTQMAGLIAAPRGYGGSSVGAAYNCDLVAIRATSDVVLSNNREYNGVTDALVYSANRGDVRIISMSIGTPFWNNQIADAIYYTYNNGKMIFAAAGTSTWYTSWVGVVFPARMAQTVAITGVKDSPSLVKCNTCHSGSQVDFVAVMQRSNDNDRTSLTLALSGNQPARVGGSSAATATTAGAAALVWSTNPSMSRSQVLQRLKNASQFYPARNSQFGWGKIDVAAAVNAN